MDIGTCTWRYMQTLCSSRNETFFLGQPRQKPAKKEPSEEGSKLNQYFRTLSGHGMIASFIQVPRLKPLTVVTSVAATP